MTGKALHERTAIKYRGAMASNYEAKRKKQLRWHQENKIVTDMLSALPPGSVLDAPVGTGRFLPLYKKLKLTGLGIDTSVEMLKQARRKSGADRLTLRIGNLLLDNLPSAQTAVCVRFLDLIDEPAMQISMIQLMQTATQNIILTIRLGGRYILKSNTATHDRRKFMQLIAKRGWQVAEDIPIFTQGWHVLRLEKVKRNGR